MFHASHETRTHTRTHAEYDKASRVSASPFQSQISYRSYWPSVERLRSNYASWRLDAIVSAGAFADISGATQFVWSLRQTDSSWSHCFLRMKSLSVIFSSSSLVRGLSSSSPSLFSPPELISSYEGGCTVSLLIVLALVFVPMLSPPPKAVRERMVGEGNWKLWLSPLGCPDCAAAYACSISLVLCSMMPDRCKTAHRWVTHTKSRMIHHTTRETWPGPWTHLGTASCCSPWLPGCPASRPAMSTVHLQAGRVRYGHW